MLLIGVVGSHIATVTNVRSRLLDGGATGLSVFFTVSGFLITSLLLQEFRRTQTVNKRAFWIRRAQRLFPSLGVMLVVVTVYRVTIAPKQYFDFTPVGLLSVVGYFANWYEIATTQASLGALTHTYSLSIEEHFYIVWPIVLTIVMRRKRADRLLLVLIIVAGAISALLRAAIWHHGGTGSAIRIFCGSDTNAECIFWGCGLAVLARRAPGLLRLFANGAWVGIVVLFGLFELPRSNASVFVLKLAYVAAPTLAALAACSVIAAIILDRRVTKPLSSRPLTWLGRLSYDVYLWHFPVILALRSAGVTSAVVLALLTAAIAIPVSMATYELTRHVRHRGRAARSAGASPPVTGPGGIPVG
jgi:peptidoglycan/LPS O-acetylase OafA/YrhL